MEISKNCDCSIGPAVKGHLSEGLGRFKANVHLNGNKYKNVSFKVLNDLLTVAILGQDFMARQKMQIFTFVEKYILCT